MEGAGHQTGLGIPDSGLHSAWAQGLWVPRRGHRSSQLPDRDTLSRLRPRSLHWGVLGTRHVLLQAAVARTCLGTYRWQLPVWGCPPRKWRNQHFSKPDQGRHRSGCSVLTVNPSTPLLSFPGCTSRVRGEPGAGGWCRAKSLSPLTSPLASRNSLACQFFSPKVIVPPAQDSCEESSST